MDGHWIVAGNEIFDPMDKLRRYCGLPWSGGHPETWAFQYFDMVPLVDGPDRLSEIDVLACSSLLPQIQPRWFSWLHEEGLEQLSDWASHVPRDVDLCDASPGVREMVFELGRLGRIPLSLTSKLAHRLRPRVVPLYDATIGKRYDLIHGTRGSRGWRDFVAAFTEDLRRNRSGFGLQKAVDLVSEELQDATSGNRDSGFVGRDWLHEPLAMTRAVDIVVYVDDQLRRRANPDLRRKQLPPLELPIEEPLEEPLTYTSEEPLANVNARANPVRRKQLPPRPPIR